MKWTKKLEQYSTSYRLTARYKKNKLKVIYNSYYKHFYFLVDMPNDKTYNSAWDNLSYHTEQEAIDACIAYIDNKPLA